MDNEFTPDLITLVDEDGKEQEFEIVDTIEENGTEYFALMPILESNEEMLNYNGEYFILELVEEDGEEQFAEVIDKETRARLSRIFEDRYNDTFYED